jgi:hypothetical protein
MTVVRFPPFRLAAVFVLNTADGWLVLVPRGHGWLHGDRRSALQDAQWLARNLELPIRGIAP